MKKKTLARDEMLDAVSRHGNGQWHGLESYTDDDLKEEYETRIVSLKIVEQPVIKIKYKLDDKFPEMKF